MEKLIHCTDGSLAPMIAKQIPDGTWEIFGLSEVFGMGSGDFKKKIFDFVISDLMILNSMSGISYIGIKKDQNWGLIEVKDNNTRVIDIDNMSSLIDELSST